MGEALEKARAAKAASYKLGALSSQVRNAALDEMADALVAGAPAILQANAADMEAARAAGTTAGLLDRLLLDEGRIADMAQGMRSVARQPEVLGQVIEGRTLYNGLELVKKRVPLGVVAMIYEARPNVTADAVALCVKTGNACVLRGGSLAQRSCLAIAGVLAEAAAKAGLPQGCIQIIESTDRALTDELMGLTGLIDVLIPRGGAGLIQHCVQSATVPVIQTGTGNCHIYLSRDADRASIVPIVVNAKTQRMGVCNAAESLLVDDDAADELLPDVFRALDERGVTLHADEHAARIADGLGIEALPATEDDWKTEYLSADISVKCVSGVEEAIAHINRYGTGHSESVLSLNAATIERFLNGVDAAVVYANASTRFSDGAQFGLGAEIGISTQKLHARGPMGAEALTSTKFVVRGSGQVRE